MIDLTQSNILTIFGFLAAFSILGVVSGNNAILDIIVLSSIALYVVYLIFDKAHAKSDAVAELKRELLDANTLIYVGIMLLVLHVFMFVMSKFGSAPFSLGIFISFGWIYLVILLLVNFTSSVFQIPVVDMIFNDISLILPSFLTTKTDVTVQTASATATPVTKTGEVFNVSNNLYTYDDAQNICSAYGARLATYDDIEAAYNNGAEWCNYGWSDGQMAYFPTQKSTWAKLQGSESTKNNCGRPGVNGGYMANPNIKFGVNCFGTKPAPTNSDLLRLSVANTQLSPVTQDQVALNQKVQYWKDNADKMLVVNSYNRQKWSEY